MLATFQKFSKFLARNPLFAAFTSSHRFSSPGMEYGPAAFFDRPGRIDFGKSQALEQGDHQLRIWSPPIRGITIQLRPREEDHCRSVGIEQFGVCFNN